MTIRDTQSMAEYRAHLDALHERCAASGKPLFLTDHGQVTTVLLSARTYEQLAHQAEQAGDVEAMRAAFDEFNAGNGVDARSALADIARQLGLKLRR